MKNEAVEIFNFNSLLLFFVFYARKGYKDGSTVTNNLFLFLKQLDFLN